jgi:NagD protein
MSLAGFFFARRTGRISAPGGPEAITRSAEIPPRNDTDKETTMEYLAETNADITPERVEADAFLMDMDGVLVRGANVIPGAVEFIARLRALGKPFLILTNNSLYTPRDLQARLAHTGLDVPPEALYTSALATAQFLHRQCPGGRAYVIGEAGLTTALHDVDYVLTEQDPDYVVLGETHSYSFQRLAQAIRLVAAGARFIATNPDVVGPAEEGLVPATGAVAALIAEATGVRPYFVGKPNPLMIRSALRQIGAHSETAVMIGDRMDTDIVAGTEAGMPTVLVLSGVTRPEQVERFPYRPTLVVESVADIDPAVRTQAGDIRQNRIALAG